MTRKWKLSENHMFSSNFLVYDCYRSAACFLYITIFLSYALSDCAYNRIQSKTLHFCMNCDMNRKRAAQLQQATCSSRIRTWKLSENQIFSSSILVYDCYRSAGRFFLMFHFLGYALSDCAYNSIKCKKFTFLQELRHEWKTGRTRNNKPLVSQWYE